MGKRQEFKVKFVFIFKGKFQSVGVEFRVVFNGVVVIDGGDVLVLGYVFNGKIVDDLSVGELSQFSRKDVFYGVDEQSVVGCGFLFCREVKMGVVVKVCVLFYFC